MEGNDPQSSARKHSTCWWIVQNKGIPTCFSPTASSSSACLPRRGGGCSAWLLGRSGACMRYRLVPSGSLRLLGQRGVFCCRSPAARILTYLDARLCRCFASDVVIWRIFCCICPKSSVTAFCENSLKLDLASCVCVSTMKNSTYLIVLLRMSWSHSENFLLSNISFCLKQSSDAACSRTARKSQQSILS